MKILYFLFFLICLAKSDDKCEKFNSALIKYLFTGKLTEEHETVGKMILHSGTFIQDLGDFAGCTSFSEGEYYRFSIEKGQLKIITGLCLYKHCTRDQIEKAKTQVESQIQKKFPAFSLESLKFTRPRHNDNNEENDLFVGRLIVLPILLLILLINLFAAVQVNILKSESPYLKLFDPITNLKSIAKPFPYSDTSCLNGIRFVAMFGVVFGHTYFGNIMLGQIKNINGIEKMLKSPTGAILVTCYYAVDTFFFLSGFLFRINIPKNKLINSEASIKKKIFLPILIRYIRLLPIILFIIFGIYYTIDFFGFGAFQDVSQMICAEGPSGSWKILLYVNNFFGYECQGEIWYLANDMQFFILSLIVVVLVKSHKTQDLVFSFLLFGSVIFSFVLSYYKRFGYNQFLFPEPQDKDYKPEYYNKPYTRIQPYLVGLLFANLYLEFKRDKQEERLNASEEKPSIYTRINRLMGHSEVARGIYLLIGLFLLVNTFIVHYWVNNLPERMSVLTAAFLNASVKFLSIFGLGILIHLSFLGRLKVFEYIFSCDIFSTFTKIGYSVYLLHVNVLILFVMNLNSILYMSSLDFFFYAVSVFGLASLFGLIVTAVYDSPVTKTVSMLMK